MPESQNSKQFDLEDRTYKFAVAVRMFVKQRGSAIFELDDCKQLVRSSGSVAANYVEANESLSRKDFVMRIKICRKEAKESILWLRLLASPDELRQEATELMKIFGAIIEKSK